MPRTLIPTEFEDLLSPAGRRILNGGAEICGALADPRRRFVSLEDMISKSKADALRRQLDPAMWPLLSELNAPIPPETIWAMEENNDDWLPKVARLRTAYLENKRTRSWQVAKELGVIDLLLSESLRDFAAAIAGRALDRMGGQQVICYGPGDYTGPHTDHYPKIKRAAKGYLDLHISLASPAVESQFLVYARAGHFSEMVPVHRTGTITLYRLPFWHYTTPLVAKQNARGEARRWLLLGTFLYAG